MQRRRLEDVSAIHPGADISTLPKAAIEGGDIFLPASRESEVNKLVMPIPKTDSFGIGYDISIQNPEMVDFLVSKGRDGQSSEKKRDVYRVNDLFQRKTKSSTAHVSGGKFTSGFAYEEDADDVYGDVDEDGAAFVDQDETEEDAHKIELQTKQTLPPAKENNIQITELKLRCFDGRNPLPGLMRNCNNFHTFQSKH